MEENMNILILNGSPRKNGNTSNLIKAFKEEAEGNKHEVTVVNLAGMTIKLINVLLSLNYYSKNRKL